MTTVGASTTTRRRLSGRTLAAVVLGASLVVGAVAVATRNDGYPQRDVRVFAGTRWLVDRRKGSVVLADAASGRATARIVTDRVGHLLDTVQSPSGAFLIDRTSREVVSIDQKGVKLADTRQVDELDDTAVYALGAGTDGAVAAPRDGSAVTIPETGQESVTELPATTSDRMITVDGAIWTRALAGRIQQTVGGRTRQILTGAPKDAVLGAVGPSAVLLDRADRTLVWLLEDHRVALPLTLELADAVVQSPGADAPCIWIGAADQLMCVSRDTVMRALRLDRFSFRPTDRLLAADGVVAVLRTDGSVVRIDPATGAVEPITEVDWDERLRPVVATDEVVVWIDDPDGPIALALTSQSTRVISKEDEGAAEFDDEGVPTVSDRGSGGSETTLVPQGAAPAQPDRPVEPDDNGIDDPPVAIDDHAQVREGSSVTIRVTANDFDPDGGPVAVAAVTRAAHGGARQLDAASVVYSPEAGSLLDDSFEYTIIDTDGKTATATVTIRVRDQDADNLPPEVANDIGATAPELPIIIDVLANDIDPEGEPLVIAEPSIDPTNGTVEIAIAPGGRPELRITPAAATAGREIDVTYRARDTEGAESAQATVRVRVSSESDGNHAPVAVSDVAQVTAGGTVAIPVLANDSDDDNDVLAIDSVGLPGRDGTAAVRDGYILYTAPASLEGPVSFPYVVSDPDGLQDHATVLVNVIAAGAENQAPVAIADVEEAGDGPNTFSPLVNDIDPDGDPLVITEVRVLSGPGSRAAIVDHDGSHVFYSPESQGPPTTRLSYTVSDGRGRNSSATITVTIRPARASQGPVARPDADSIAPGETKNFDVTVNDTDPNGDDLLIRIVGGCNGAGCTVTADQQIRVVAPQQSSVSRYAITYEVENSEGQTDQTILRLDVVTARATALGPTAIPDSVVVAAGRSATVDVLDNDLDGDTPSDRLTITGVTNADPTISTREVNGSIEVTAAAGPRRSTAFTYVVSDPDGHSAVGTVAVSVQNPSNRPPNVPSRVTRLTAGTSTNWNFLDGVTDTESTQSELRLVGRPRIDQDTDLLSVSAVPNSPGTYRITAAPGPGGDATITFEVADGADGRSTGTLDVTIVPVQNRAPTTTQDEVSTPANVAVDIDVLANDADPDGDAITARIARPPAADQGTVAMNGRLVRFTPNPDFAGDSTFTYQAVDPSGKLSETERVTVKVAACADGPAPIDDLPNEFTPYDTPTTIRVASGLTAPVRIDSVSNGTVDQPSPGVLTFVPTPGTNGSGTVKYSVSNSCGARRSAILTIDVNRAPRLDATGFVSALGRPLDIAVNRIASDEEPLVITSATSPAGDVAISADRTKLTLTPRGTTPTITSIAVTVSDPGGLTASGTLTLDLRATVNAAPRASDDVVMILPGATTTLDVLSNDSDPDGSTATLTVQINTPTVTFAEGSVALVLSPDHRQLIATATGDAHGRATFTYVAVDPSGEVSQPATVELTVNRSPRTVNFEPTIPAGTTVTFSAYAPGVASDPDDGDATVSHVTSSSDPRVIVDFLPGLLIEVAVPADVPPGDVVVKYAISDYLGGVGIGTLTIHVVSGGTPTTPPPATATPAPTGGATPSGG